MNMLSGAHSMRIIALPLARVKRPRDVKIKPHSDLDLNNTMLVFYHFDLVSPCGGREDLSWHRKVLKSATNKAVDLWTSLGKAPKGSWKLWTYQLGERIIDKTEFEELALRSVDPSLGPAVTPLTSGVERVGDVKGQSPHSLTKIPLTYPPSLYPACPKVGTNHALPPPLSHLQAFLARREPRHRRGFFLWMLVTPLTFPIMLIPLIPNLPLFFCVWRSWSHYRAYRSSQYLTSLLKHGLIEPNPSLELDELYAPSTPSSGASQNLPPPTLASRSSEKKSAIRNATTNERTEGQSGTESTQSECILTHEAVPRILDLLRLPESATENMHRAITQARGRLGE